METTNMNALAEKMLCEECASALTPVEVAHNITVKLLEDIETGGVLVHENYCSSCLGMDKRSKDANDIKRWTLPNATGIDGTASSNSTISLGWLYGTDNAKKPSDLDGRLVCAFCYIQGNKSTGFTTVDALTTTGGKEPIDVCAICARKYGFI